MPVGVISIGSHVPPRVVTNREIAAWTGATEEWLAERTGVVERRYAADEDATSDLATLAAQDALADLEPRVRKRLALLVVATCTPDHPQPATAALVQDRLGLTDVPAFDVNAVCSGFLYALTITEAMLKERPDAYGLIVGADIFSRIMDRRDRRTVSLFGDGAGAVVLGHVPDGYGILASRLRSDGTLHHLVGVEAGGTRSRLDEDALAAGRHLFQMDGRQVREYAMTTLERIIEETLADCGMKIDEVDRFVFHQANTRLLESFAATLGIDSARVALTAPTWATRRPRRFRSPSTTHTVRSHCDEANCSCSPPSEAA